MASLKSYGEWALVTGASAGIGTAFARELAAQSVNLVLVARRADRLEALAAELREKHGVKTRVVPDDLERDGAAERLLEWVRDLEIGILVNNAGFSMVGRFERVPREKILGMIRVNCLAVAALTHAFLPAMQARRRGAVIIVSSVAGYQPLGFAATYGATKAFDLMLGEALWAENRSTGVDVLALSPGPVDTELDRKSTRLNSSHGYISYAVFCLKKKNTNIRHSHAHIDHALLCSKHDTAELHVRLHAACDSIYVSVRAR